LETKNKLLPAAWALQRPGLLVLVLALCLSETSRGDISLPLQGYYRTGRYMPVRVSSAPSLFSGENILPTVVESRVDSIVPVLIYGPTATLNSTLKLQPLADDERLIAFDGDAQRFAQSLFPGEKIVAISVDPSDPLPGAPAAWEALDAIVLDLPAMTRLNSAHRSALLAAGTILAVASDTPPDVIWPWKHQGRLWILRHQPVGPVDQLIDASVFSPTYAWAPGSAPALRRQILIAGALLGIAVVAVAMWRSRAAVVAIILLSLISTAGAILWRHNMGIVDQTGGDIVVASDSLVQRDSWLYERARREGIRRVDWNGSAHPILASISQLQTMQMRIVVTAAGSLAFEYHAKPGETVSFVQRDVRPGAVSDATPSHNSPLRELARDRYLTTGYRIAGEQSVADGSWNTVIIENITPTSGR
jgi:hypothetical protein